MAREFHPEKGFIEPAKEPAARRARRPEGEGTVTAEPKEQGKPAAAKDEKGGKGR